MKENIDGNIWEVIEYTHNDIEIIKNGVSFARIDNEEMHFQVPIAKVTISDLSIALDLKERYFNKTSKRI